MRIMAAAAFRTRDGTLVRTTPGFDLVEADPGDVSTVAMQRWVDGSWRPSWIMYAGRVYRDTHDIHDPAGGGRRPFGRDGSRYAFQAGHLSPFRMRYMEADWNAVLAGVVGGDAWTTSVREASDEEIATDGARVVRDLGRSVANHLLVEGRLWRADPGPAVGIEHGRVVTRAFHALRPSTAPYRLDRLDEALGTWRLPAPRDLDVALSGVDLPFFDDDAYAFEKYAGDVLGTVGNVVGARWRPDVVRSFVALRKLLYEGVELTGFDARQYRCAHDESIHDFTVREGAPEALAALTSALDRHGVRHDRKRSASVVARGTASSHARIRAILTPEDELALSGMVS